jgi:hypothetical protein
MIHRGRGILSPTRVSNIRHRLPGGKMMDYQVLLDHYPWAADHENAIQTVAKFLCEDFEMVLRKFDARILKKVAKDNLQLPEAA